MKKVGAIFIVVIEEIKRSKTKQGRENQKLLWTGTQGYLHSIVVINRHGHRHRHRREHR